MRRYALPLYVLVVSALGVIVAGVSAYRDYPLNLEVPLIVVALLLAGFLIGEAMPVLVGRNNNTSFICFSGGFCLALLMVAPVTVALTAQCLSILAVDIRIRLKPERTLFNCAQYAICFEAAVYVFQLITSQRYLTEGTISALQLFGLTVAGMTLLLLNYFFIGIATALATARPVFRHVINGSNLRLLPFLFDLVLAPMCLAALHYSPILLPLFIFPGLIIRHSAKLASLREHEALHDVLTGLPNRALLRNTFLEMAPGVRKGDFELSVMLIDLDHFKEINDTLGHQVGDLLLCEVSRRLSSALREGDLVARLGGDEFAVLSVTSVGHAGEESAALADRLVRSLDKPFYADAVRIDVQGSVGVSLAPVHGTDMELLMSRADIALYQAKENRGTWAVYDPASDERTPEHLSLLGQLREGIEAGEVVTHYQPKVDLLTGRIVGVEALARWHHPERGLLGAHDFIPLAESTGLIMPLTLEILDQALRQTRAWLNQGRTLHMAVNLSVRHLTDTALPAQVAEVLHRNDVPPEMLTLEVTESTVMSDPEQAAAILRDLRMLGIRIALDDYGVGYCSLAYLCRLQVDELKIDRSLIKGLVGSGSDELVVRSTIALAHDLGLRVVAEGVEDEQTAVRLGGLGCDVAQGYHFSAPLAAGAMQELLDRPLTWFDPTEASLAQLTEARQRTAARAS